MDAAGILREARVTAALSQRELAQRAGVTQSVISAYEQRRREPSVPTLRKLVEATGTRLEIRALPRPAPARKGPSLRALVAERRDQLLGVTAAHGIGEVRLFGSAARGDEHEGSDVDLLVDLPAGTSLLAVSALRRELEAVLGVAVDVVPLDGIKPHLRTRILAEAVAV
jgi:predicted nucleotidyltransferase/DNA-binding XRE family transcriptional regulator